MEPVQRSRWPLIAAFGGALAVAAVIVVVATRSPSRTTAANAPADAANVLDATAIAERAPIDATLGPEGSATAPTNVPTDAPTNAPTNAPTDAPAGSSQVKTPTPLPTPNTPTGTKPTGTKPTGTKPTATKPTGTKPTGTGTKPTTTPTPAADTSASTVANLYGVVGRELKVLDTKHGPDVSQPMWGRFRQLRINDALQTPEKRAAAEKMLSQLRRDIAAAM
jgi:hypothetical protein